MTGITNTAPPSRSPSAPHNDRCPCHFPSFGSALSWTGVKVHDRKPASLGGLLWPTLSLRIGELTASFDGRSMTYGFGELHALCAGVYAGRIYKSQCCDYRLW